MEIYENKFLHFHNFSFFLVSITILSYTLIYPYRSFKHSTWWRHKFSGDSRVRRRWGRPLLYWFILLSKSRCFRVKDIYIVVRMCDKWGRSW